MKNRTAVIFVGNTWTVFDLSMARDLTVLLHSHIRLRVLVFSGNGMPTCSNSACWDKTNLKFTLPWTAWTFHVTQGQVQWNSFDSPWMTSALSWDISFKFRMTFTLTFRSYSGSNQMVQLDSPYMYLNFY